MKSQWARDDPAFLVLFCLVLARVSSVFAMLVRVHFIGATFSIVCVSPSGSKQYHLRTGAAPLVRRLAEAGGVARVHRLHRRRAGGRVPLLVRRQPLPAHELGVASLERDCEPHCLIRAIGASDRRYTRIPRWRRRGLDVRHWCVGRNESR